MTERIDQWICIKFCIKLEHSSVETIWMIQKAFGGDTINAVQIKVWHKYFKDGWESVKSDPHSGRPATSRTPENVERLWAAVNKEYTEWWLTELRELEADLGIPKTTASKFWHKILVWNALWQNSYCSFCSQSTGTLCCHWQWLDWNCYWWARLGVLDFWLFPKPKSPLKRKRFYIVDEIPKNMMGQLMVILTKNSAQCFEQWKRHWENLARSQSTYSEEN